jgi:hypothetical protein
VSLDDFLAYFQSLVATIDSQNHTKSIRKVIYPFASLALNYIDRSEGIEARTVSGETKNCVWVHIKGRRYFFGYTRMDDQRNPINLKIDIREGTHRGRSLLKVDDETDLKKLIDFFKNPERY